MNLFLIDAIGPFFLGYEKRVVNWSKIPFVNLEKEGGLDAEKAERILTAMKGFLERVSAMGYNAVTLDDIAHLISFDFYPETYAKKIKQYQDLYRKIFSMAAEQEIRVFMNTDVVFFNTYIEQWLNNDRIKTIELLYQTVQKALSEFPIAGIVFRIGETDGEDVEGDFKSRILIKTPRQANEIIKHLLPAFEQHNKTFIFRNWTVGAYPIGDLIWNRETYDKAFSGINSEHFVISMKYGDTDFFSGLELNPIFFTGFHKKIIELQTRRERECFGIFPYYVGWEYEKYYHLLKHLKNLAGISVWCQTGGWSRNKNLTFVDNSSTWNELNTIAAIRIFRDNVSADDAIRRFFSDDAYIDFLRSFNEVFTSLLYIEDFAAKKLYFRRTRIPPMLWLSWDYITINPLMTSIHLGFSDLVEELDESELERIYEQGIKLNIENMEYCYDTLRLFLFCRKALLGQYKYSTLMQDIEAFRQKYHPCNFKFKVKDGRFFVTPVKLLFKILTRTRPEYRLMDRILLSRLPSSIIYRSILLFAGKGMPKFSNKRAMKLDVIFK